MSTSERAFRGAPIEVLVKLTPKVVLPVAVVAFAGVVMVVLISTRPSAKSVRPTIKPPPVQVVRVQPSALEVWIESQGSVEPRTESTLVSEVSGRVEWVSPRMASGGFFEAGAVLARVDRRDYEVALERAEAALARARGDEKHATAALVRQRAMRTRGAASEARLEDAILGVATAHANARDAAAAVTQATLDLERTQLIAPFAGRVYEKLVDVGQFVTRGAGVARVYAVDYAEVRLPITDDDLAFLDLPLRYRDPSEPSDENRTDGPEVRLSARFAGARHTWPARIVRVEGALDAQTRMLHAVARIDDPYGHGDDPGRPPLSVGLFVDAEIRGRSIDEVFELPRSALRRRDQVLVVDAEDRVRFRRVETLRSDGERSWIRSGLTPGERVVVSSLEAATEGMAVRRVGEDGSPASVASANGAPAS